VESMLHQKRFITPQQVMSPGVAPQNTTTVRPKTN
jgi:hypothetical protein